MVMIVLEWHSLSGNLVAQGSCASVSHPCPVSVAAQAKLFAVVKALSISTEIAVLAAPSGYLFSSDDDLPSVAVAVADVAFE